MSDQLDAINALAADFEPLTAQLSPDTRAVLFYAADFLQNRRQWLNPEDPEDEITDEQWDEIEEKVAEAFRELMTPMIGQIVELVTAEFPVNVLPCDGTVYNRVDFPSLYAALDAAFIDDADTFHVPDLRERVTMGESETYTFASTGGEHEHQLTVDELASHVHSYNKPEVPTLVLEPGEVPVSTLDLFPDVTGSTGGDVPHNNDQPYMVVRKGIIAW